LYFWQKLYGSWGIEHAQGDVTKTLLIGFEIGYTCGNIQDAKTLGCCGNRNMKPYPGILRCPRGALWCYQTRYLKLEPLNQSTLFLEHGWTSWIVFHNMHNPIEKWNIRKMLQTWIIFSKVSYFKHLDVWR